MLIAGVLCASAAVLSAAFALRALTRTRSADPAHVVQRMMAPTQVAAAGMLGAGAVVALAGPAHGAVTVLVICVAGALGTVAAGSWQGARYAARQRARRETGSGCGCGCACSQSGVSSC
ncbi:MAG TPA: hypothetical protein VFR17_08390 [Mycobacterium sp.]|nr:hypothetical protein [Mycobacterium sp.]